MTSQDLLMGYLCTLTIVRTVPSIPHPLESDMQHVRSEASELGDVDAAASDLHEQQHFQYSPPPN